MPEEVTRGAQTFEELRAGAVCFAHARERAETKGRSHYRTVLSFERKMETQRAAALVREWVRDAFPQARALAFVHQNTEHTHAHVWLDARKPDGRKLHLSAPEYRRLDEAWNRIYCREMERDEREHLAKKYERGHDSIEGRETGALPAWARSGRTSPGERAIAEAVAADERAVRAVDLLRRDAARMDRAARGPQQRDQDRQPERER